MNISLFSNVTLNFKQHFNHDSPLKILAFVLKPLGSFVFVSCGLVTCRIKCTCIGQF